MLVYCCSTFEAKLGHGVDRMYRKSVPWQCEMGGYYTIAMECLVNETYFLRFYLTFRNFLPQVYCLSFLIVGPAKDTNTFSGLPVWYNIPEDPNP